MNKRHVIVVSFAVAITILSWDAASALPLSYVSDLISTSAPSASASHTIQFTATNAISASGRIIVSFPEGDFSIPAALDYHDIDLAVATSAGSYIDRSLAASASATNDGVAVVSGSGKSITFTLNTTAGIPAGNRVQIRIGTIATFGGAGIHSIVDPSAQGSYRIRINTYDQASTLIDYGTAMIAVVNPVSVGTSVVVFAPVRSNGLPSGTIAAGSANVELSLNTNVSAHCRYATSTNVAYAAMTGYFYPSTIDTIHYTVVTGLQDNTTYTYFVRCAEVQGVANTDDFPITFTLAPTPSVKTSGGGAGNGIVGNGGAGPYLNGSPVLYLASVTLVGTSSPLSTVIVLTDGGTPISTQAKQDGSFRVTISGLERGAYTFQAYAKDSKGNQSNTISSTMTLGSASINTISGIQLVFSAASSPYSASTSSTGDQNGDNKVNLADFSIMLSNWGTSNPASDLNGDGVVNLADFSILLFHWTG